VKAPSSQQSEENKAGWTIVRTQQEIHGNKRLSSEKAHENEETEKKPDGGDIDVEGDMIVGELEQDNGSRRPRCGKELIKGGAMELVKGSSMR
jgi:hypothetical protein